MKCIERELKQIISTWTINLVFTTSSGVVMAPVIAPARELDQLRDSHESRDLYTNATNIGIVGHIIED